MYNKIALKSKNLVFERQKKYTPQGRSKVVKRQLIVSSDTRPDALFLVHEVMIFERGSIADSSYSVWSFDKNEQLIKKESVEQLGMVFFKTMKTIEIVQ